MGILDPLAMGHPEFESYGSIDNGACVETNGTTGTLHWRALPDQEDHPTTESADYPFLPMHD